MPSIELALAAELGRRWVGRDDERFNDARRVFNGDIDRRPLGVAYCAATDDVVTVARLAGAAGQKVTVRGSGHNVAGRSVANDCVVIDVSGIDSVVVDPAERMARAGAGATWAHFDAATQIHGLATTGGTVSSTGLAGLTVGGGVGWLLPTLGLSCDSLVAATVVATDGRVIAASDASEPELMWALRGGGFGLGVVTDFRFALAEVADVYGGALVYNLADAAEVLRALGASLGRLPRSTMVSPAFLASGGQVVLELDIVVSGERSDVSSLLAQLAGSPQPAANTIARQPYCSIQKMLDNPFRRGACAYWKSAFVSGLNERTISGLVQAAAELPTPESLIMVEHYHGAYTEPQRPSAYPHRDKSLNVLFVANWAAADRELSARARAWARAGLESIDARLGAPAYANYLANDDPTSAGGLKTPRLDAVAATLDPLGIIVSDGRTAGPPTAG